MNSNRAITFTFRLRSLEKVWTLLSHQQLVKLVFLLFLYKDGFGIEYPKNVYMLLNKETKSNQTKHSSINVFFFTFSPLWVFFLSLLTFPFLSFPFISFEIFFFNCIKIITSLFSLDFSFLVFLKIFLFIYCCFRNCRTSIWRIIRRMIGEWTQAIVACICLQSHIKIQLAKITARLTLRRIE